MGKWINNISQHKPEGYCPVLVFLPNEPETEKIQVKEYHLGSNSWSDTNLDYWNEDDEVSHWMELPKYPNNAKG